MAWRVELADSAARQLRKLDPQIAKRILTFLRDRVARSTTRAVSAKRCAERNSAISGNTASVIGGSSPTSMTVWC